MTDKQRAYIESLAAQRALPANTQGAYVARLVAGEAAQPNARQASAIIEWLQALPALPAATPAPQTSDADVPAGRYAIVTAEGVTKFYRVDKPEDGRWAGYTFVKVQASDEWYPVKQRDAKRAVLTAIAADPIAAMIRYGHEIGACGRCGRTLTDETSRAMGIGPECAQILGIDRSPYAERARQERVAQVQAGAEDAPATTLDDAIDDQRERGEWHPRHQDEIDGDAFGRYEAEQEAAAHLAAMDADTWRERKAAVAAQQGRRSRVQLTPEQRARIHDGELPGTTWEDIFGMGGA